LLEQGEPTLEVTGDRDDQLRAALPALAEPGGRPAMQLRAFAVTDRLVGHLVDQGVVEAELPVTEERALGFLHDEAGGAEAAKRRGRDRPAGERGHGAVPEGLSHDGRGLGDALRLRRQELETGRDEGAK